MSITDRQIKDLFLAHGFKEKPQVDGAYNLNPYVFEAARALIDLAAAQPQPAAHLTIPGALEWDGDKGTHGADGESRAHGESSELERLKEKLEAIRARPNSIDHSAGAKIPNALDAWGRPVPQHLPYDFSGNPGASAIQYCNGWNDSGSYWKNHVIDIEAQLASTEQSRRSFFDLSQDLEKRLAERDAAIKEFIRINGMSIQNSSAHNKALLALAAVVDPAKCESCGDWGHIETEDSAHDCPECGPSVVERAVEAGVMNAPGKCYEPHDGPKCGDPDYQNGDDSFSVLDCPDCACVQDGDCLCVPSKPCATPAKTKICIECEQPYCHGVCVERGDQDYDRDQAAKGGEQ